MAVGRAVPRLGEAARRYEEAWSEYHADRRSQGAPSSQAPAAVVLGVGWLPVRNASPPSPPPSSPHGNSAPSLTGGRGRSLPRGQDRCPAVAPRKGGSACG